MPLCDGCGASCLWARQPLWALWRLIDDVEGRAGGAGRAGREEWREDACGGQMRGAGEGQRNLQDESKSVLESVTLTTVN